jgi:hypothetical protein
MGKRVSGPPRRPRDPVAKVVPDKRWHERLKETEETPDKPTES